MTRARKRIGAWCLVVSMACSLLAEIVPAHAAGAGGGAPTPYDRPELVMDFLGDNKTGYNDGQPGSGSYVSPQDTDQASADGGADGKWDGYVSGDQGSGNQTIFWIGIGIKNIDQFVLSNGGRGLHSAELALYYNPDYVEPYVDPTDGFQTTFEQENIGANPLNQWDSDYRVKHALTDQDPLNDPVDADTGYGTEEFSAPGGWRMTYVSVEKKEDTTGTARFKSGNNADSTYYIAMIPFVLKGYDSAKELCIRLSRNASTFSMGSASGATGAAGTGYGSYGNWDKYTYHDPAHDLKLMLDYTGDLNIFTNSRQRDSQRANLIVYDGGNSGNTAELVINNEPFAPPYSQYATATGEHIDYLSGGEELKLTTNCVTGYTVTVAVSDASGNTVSYVTLPSSTAGEQGYTFIMPTGTDVIVTVTFSGSPNPDTEYKATLTIDTNYNGLAENTAKLSVPGGTATTAITNQGDSVSLMTTANNSVDVVLTRNSDYDVAVEAKLAGSGGTLPVTAVNVTDTALTYRFVMPASDAEVSVKFTLAPKYKATISVHNAGGQADNKAQLSFTDGNGVVQQSSVVTGVDTPDGNFVETRAGRVVTISTGCDSAYRIKQVTVTRNGGTTMTAVTQSPTDVKQYTFTMPGYDVGVVVEYEKVPVYKVKLVVVDAQGSETATLEGVDARGTFTVTRPDSGETPPDEGMLEVFANAAMKVTFSGLVTGRTASVSVSYPGDVINTVGNPATGFTFGMVALDSVDQEVTVRVEFKTVTESPLTAKIRQEYHGGASGASSALWTGTNHNNPISVYPGDNLSVDITVEAGTYISRIQVVDDSGQPLAVPINVSGIGYNGGQGGQETASFTMPGVNATVLIEYTKGTPPEEPTFYASISAAGNGGGTVQIHNDTATRPGANSASLQAAWAGDIITATYSPAPGSYVSGVTVTADVPGTAVSWQYLPGGAVELTMPAANVVVEVTFALIQGTSYQLGIEKAPSALDGNKVSTITSAGTFIQCVEIPVSTTAYAGELVTLTIDTALGYHIQSVEVQAAAPVPVTLSGTGYNGGAVGNETAVFAMPGEDATVIVTFAAGAPTPSITLKVTQPAGAGNKGELFLNGASHGVAPGDVTTTTVAGDLVEVQAIPASGHGLSLPVLTTPNGVVALTWTGPDRFQFVMPAEPVTVVLPFETGGGTQFRADLILRGDPAGVNAARATFGGYGELSSSSLVYSRTAHPGEEIPYAVQVPAGYYISSVSVTPADFGVTPTITGMIGTQSGGFTMPAGNVYLNIEIAAGWPDQVEYPVTLHVSDPAGGSGATLANLSTNIVKGPVTDGGTESLRALDGTGIRVELFPDTNSVLERLEVVDGSGRPVTYRWTTGTGGVLAVEFDVPGSSVDVYVSFKAGAPDAHQVELILHGDAGSTASLENTTSAPGVTSTTMPISAVVGDMICVSVNPQTAATLVVSAFAVTSEGGLVNIDPNLVGASAAASGTFVMPIDTDVEVHVTFQDGIAPPAAGEHMLTLMVSGPTGSGTVEVSELNGGAMTATATNGSAMVVNDGSTITAKVTPASGYALYSLVAYTEGGDRVAMTLDAAVTDTYTFIMPADTTHIEAEFRAAAPHAYQIQVVVNNTVNNGLGQNAAFLYTPPGSTANPFTFKDGVSAGDLFDLALTVESGYQVSSITAVPQGSGVAANIPLPLTSSQRAQIKMPASNLVIYVVFGLDTTTRYNVTAKISYLSNVPMPVTGSNLVTVTASDGVTNASAVSYHDTATGNDVNNVGIIQEGQGRQVTAKWTCAPGYVVSSYTVTTVTGQTVLSQPQPDGTSLLFIMPGAPVVVDVVFTKPDVAPPQEFKATLHYVNGTAGDAASITEQADQSNTTNTDGGSIALPGKTLNTGDLVDVSAAPAGGRYLQSVYVLQTGQMLPLSMSDTPTSTGSFYMPSGNVDVYAVFSDNAPGPDDHTAVLAVNGPGAAAGSAVMFDRNTPATTTGTVNCGAAPSGMVVQTGGTIQVTVTVNPGYAVESVVGTPITVTVEPKVDPSDPDIYTFTMPADDVSVIVTLKAVSVVTYKLNLHVSHSISGPDDASNETTLTYGTGSGESVTSVPGSGDAMVMVAAGTEVTLAAIPQPIAPDAVTEGYFVRAAYVLRGGALVPLSQALEGVTDAQVNASPAANTAAFTMPAGTTDVYVVYEYAKLPTDPWYNVVVVATDTGGLTANTGGSEVKVSSQAAPGGTNAIDPAAVVHSNGMGTYFYSVPQGETIHLDATGAASGYQYDFMSLSAQSGAAPQLTPVDTAAHPLGEVEEFTMGGANVAAHVNFKTTGTTGLKATLHIVNPSNLTGNTVTLSVGSLSDGTYRSVNTDGAVLTDLVSSQTLSALVDPMAATTRVVQVVVTKEGYGSQQTLTSSDQLYTYTMEDRDVHIYVILAPKTQTDRFVVMAQAVYSDATLMVAGNELGQTVTNVTTSGLPQAPVWTEAKAGDQAMVEFDALAGVYVTVTAKRLDTGAAIPVAQFGVGNGSHGTAYVDVPVPGSHVQVYVEFSDTPPEAQALHFISSGHEAKSDNVAKLFDMTSATPTDPLVTLTPSSSAANPMDDLRADFVDDGTTNNGIMPGTGMKVSAGWAAGYQVSKVEITVNTAAGSITVIQPVNTSGELPVTMPTAETTIVVVYAPSVDCYAPYDPENKDAEWGRYEDGWIRVENRGDYAVVTVPTLAERAADGTVTLFNVEPDKHSFHFYLVQNPAASEPAWVYESLEHVVALSHPDPDNTTDAYESDVYYTDPGPDTTPNTADDVPYTGAKFILNVLEDGDIEAAIDGDGDILPADKAAAKTAAIACAAVLRGLLDNQGTDDAIDQDECRLFITARDDSAVPPAESEYTHVEVPQYYSLTGELDSYAPTHPAQLSLYRPGEVDPWLELELKDSWGSGFWEQTFAFKSSALVDGTYRLEIRKAAHISYSRDAIQLNAGAAQDVGGTPTFAFSDPIVLFCGDLDGNGIIEMRDRDILVEFVAQNIAWTEDVDVGAAGWANSVNNPESISYVADLDGDACISVSDLDVLMDPFNFNHSEEDYGNPTGLNFAAPAVMMLSLEELKALLNPEVTPLPSTSPTPEVTVTPAPTESPVPEETAAPTESLTPDEPEQPEESPTPEATVKPEESPAPEATEMPAESPVPEETKAPENSPGPEVTESPAENMPPEESGEPPESPPSEGAQPPVGAQEGDASPPPKTIEGGKEQNAETGEQGGFGGITAAVSHQDKALPDTEKARKNAHFKVSPRKRKIKVMQ